MLLAIKQSETTYFITIKVGIGTSDPKWNWGDGKLYKKIEQRTGSNQSNCFRSLLIIYQDIGCCQ